MKTLLIIGALLLSSCAGEITPESARAGAEAARAWLDVAREARVIIITDDK
jgi:hypothetical protein